MLFDDDNSAIHQRASMRSTSLRPTPEVTTVESNAIPQSRLQRNATFVPEDETAQCPSRFNAILVTDLGSTDCRSKQPSIPGGFNMTFSRDAHIANDARSILTADFFGDDLAIILDIQI